MTSTPYDKLVNICEEAITDTYKWERGHKRFQWTFRVIGLMNAIFAGYHIAVGSWFAVINILALALMVYMFHRGKAHLEWILEVRERWESDLVKYKFDRITYVESGYNY